MNTEIITLLAPVALVALLLLVWRRFRPPVLQEAKPPRDAVVVDGSNVMHWGGEPSANAVSQVLRSLEALGHTPIVFFDANVGYVLGDRYFDEATLSGMINIPVEHICVVDRGVVADESILAFSRDHRLPIVSNDHFRDWRVKFPHVKKKKRVMRGKLKGGNVVWRHGS